MSRVLINIRGTYGSGKTSLVKSFIDDATEYIYLNDDVVATHFKTHNLIAIGKYDNKKMGGCDLLKGQKQYFEILDYILKNYTENILLEGLLISTTFSSYYTRFNYYLHKYKIKTIILLLNPPVKLCCDRVYKRTPVQKSYKQVIEKHKSIYNASMKFKKKGFNVIIYDNSHDDILVSKDKLLKLILKNT